MTRSSSCSVFCCRLSSCLFLGMLVLACACRVPATSIVVCTESGCMVDELRFDDKCKYYMYMYELRERVRVLHNDGVSCSLMPCVMYNSCSLPCINVTPCIKSQFYVSNIASSSLYHFQRPAFNFQLSKVHSARS